jgi:hypothetical protein
MGVFVASARHGPTCRYRYDSGRSGQRLVAVSLLLFIVVAIAATLGLGPSAGLALPLCHMGGWGVPGVALRSLGTLVCQTEERGHILYIMGGELLQHLLIPYSLVKCNHYRNIGDEEWYYEPKRTTGRRSAGIPPGAIGSRGDQSHYPAEYKRSRSWP